jgi:hypothetical protein
MGTFQVSTAQRQRLLSFQGLSPAQILWGMFVSLTHQPVQEERLCSFIRIMQREVPEVFESFGDDPRLHIRALLPWAIKPIKGRSHEYEIQKTELEQMAANVFQNASDRRLQSLWPIGALFVQYRQSQRDSSRAAAAE